MPRALVLRVLVLQLVLRLPIVLSNAREIAVLGDAAARTGARNLPQIELMLLRNLAHQRRRAQPLAMRCRSGSLGRGSSRSCMGRRSSRSV